MYTYYLISLQAGLVSTFPSFGASLENQALISQTISAVLKESVFLPLRSQVGVFGENLMMPCTSQIEIINYGGVDIFGVSKRQRWLVWRRMRESLKS